MEHKDVSSFGDASSATEKAQLAGLLFPGATPTELRGLQFMIRCDWHRASSSKLFDAALADWASPSW
jgi:hypothetical protein